MGFRAKRDAGAEPAVTLRLGSRTGRLLVATLLLAWCPGARADERFKLSGDLRLRHTALVGVGLRDADPNADRTCQRDRLRLRADAAIVGPLRATARLLWEGRHYAKPDGAAWPVAGFESWYGGALLLDPRWGRWPQWSELLIYQWPLDARVGEATNVQRLGAGLLLRVAEGSSLALDRHLLRADERSTRFAAQAANLGGGRSRGLLVTGRWRRTFDAHVSAHLHAESFRPGDFYAGPRRDASSFVRAELNLAF